MVSREAARQAPSDSDVRSRVVSETTTSFLVQAPAGSGKTELLIQRYLALLGRVEEPERIVAMTFTRKAAAEMRERVVTALHEAQKGREPAPHQRTTRELASSALRRDGEKGWGILRNPARLQIQTIDSFAGRMARTAPWDEGLSVVPDAVERADSLYEAAARRVLRLLTGKDVRCAAAVRTLLKRRDNNVQGLEQLIVQMLRKRDQWMPILAGLTKPEDVRSKLEATLARIVSEALARVRALVPAGLAPEIVRLAAYAAARPEGIEAAACAHMRELPGFQAGDCEKWKGIAWLLLTDKNSLRKPRGISKSMGFERESIQRLVESLEACGDFVAALGEVRSLPPAQYDQGQWEVIEVLFELLPRAVQIFKQVCAERGTCDFVEVAQAAMTTLAASGEDLSGIDHFLVDEFQDTSAVQQELLVALTRDWKAEDGRTLFLVGDPMQSIYGFRKAEVALFLECKAQSKLRAVPLKVEMLTSNFRSQRGIVDWVNHVFPGMMPADDLSTSAVKYSQSVAQRAVAPGGAVNVKCYFKDSDERNGYEEDEARDISDLIGRLKGDVAVLARAHSHLVPLIEELRKRKMPFRAIRVESLGDKQITLDLLSLTMALLHAGDHVSWLAVLRAPWCGLNVEQLHRIANAEGGTVVERIEQCWNGLDDDARLRLTRIKPALLSAMANRGRQPLAAWVRGVWLSIGGPACLQGESDLENADTFFDLLQEVAVAGDVHDTRELIERMKTLFAAPDADENAPKLMTMHEAKGLEFDHVILPGLGRITAKNDPELLLWLERVNEQGEPELLLAPVKRKGDDSDPLVRYVTRQRNARDDEEEKRLLYVACTRARESLHLSGCATVNSKSEEPKADSRSLLKHLWPALSADFQKQYEPSPQLVLSALQAKAEQPLRPPLRRLPADWKLPEFNVMPMAAAAQATEAPRQEMTFDWVSDTLRHVGTVTHRLLQLIARDGAEKWDAARLQSYERVIRNQLVTCGVIPAEMDSAMLRVRKALANMLQDERARWVLKLRESAQNELAVSGFTADGMVKGGRIDRTFVEDGVRWIVDYKVADTKGNIDKFSEEQVEKYREQLEDYGALMHAIDGLPVRLGLYFPLLGKWEEWELQASAASS